MNTSEMKFTARHDTSRHWLGKLEDSEKIYTYSVEVMPALATLRYTCPISQSLMMFELSRHQPGRVLTDEEMVERLTKAAASAEEYL
jgi:hypothetical protein